MSRRILMMVGGDLLLVASLIVGLNNVVLTATVSGGLTHFPSVKPVYLVYVCLALIAAKYSVQFYLFYRKDIIEFQRSLLKIIAISSLPILFLALLINHRLSDVPSAALVTSLVLFGVIQTAILLWVWSDAGQVKKNKNIMVFGDDGYALLVAETIEDHHGKERFCGFINPRSADEQPDRSKESCRELLDVIKGKNISQIVVALTERRGVLPVREMFSCKLRGVQVVDAATFYEQTYGKLLLEHTNPSSFVFSEGFLITRLMFIKQRVIDIIASSLLLVLVIPFFPLIALAIRLESPGDVFYRQERCGYKEKTFQLLKFRTMKMDAEKDSGAVWASENDSRVTRFGHIMRKFRIDELPQLFNVLKGEMSFVGPRPERPEFVERLCKTIPYYSRRHSVRPGLTGWAQIRYPYGASEEDALEKLRYDLFFIKNYSIVLAIKILFGTVKVVLFGKGGR